ncbi:MAG: NAD(P)/FAD-dependent oxidoreductase [Thermoplasmatales archaeon]|nr:MAG: NAD(P)/FAD-dependent oxidoreductase [Thermoplasmatales archaeon]
MVDKIESDICIIGAGIGGLTAGALLSKNGYRVIIFEKERLIGGRALSFDTSSFTLENYIDLLSRFKMHVPFSEPNLVKIFKENMLEGYKLDLGYHAIGGGVLSNLNSILSELDDHVEILESHVGFIKDDGFDFPFLSKTDKLKILPNIFRLLFSSEKTMKQLDSVSMKETVKKYGKGKMKLILEIFSRSITTVNNLDRISTGEMFRAQKNLYKGSKPVGYPKNGLSSIHQKLADFITQNNGEIHLEKPVKKIIFDENKATGVVVEDKEYNFKTIVSNVLVQDLFTIADEKYFPKEYVKNIKSLKGTGSLCAYYSLKKINSNLLGKTFHFIERNIGVDGNDAVGMIDFMIAMPDSGLAPSSDYLVQSYIICTPEEAKDKEILNTLRVLLDKNLEKLIPDFQSHLKWAIYPAVWHLDGVAKTIDNTKLKIKTPVQNLYIIGDCVKAPGIGINCSLNSAKMLCDTLSSYS